MTAVDRLRAAHQALTDMITAATPGPWWVESGSSSGDWPADYVATGGGKRFRTHDPANAALAALAPLLAQGLADEAAELLAWRNKTDEIYGGDENIPTLAYVDGEITRWLRRWSGLLGALGQETT